MKNAVFPIIAFASCLALRAEPFSYSGKVVDSAGTGIPWAILKGVGSDVVGQSNADGSFTLTGNAATAFYADPHPKAPAIAAFPDESATVQYLLTGRAALDPRIAATVLLRLPRQGGRAAPARQALRRAAAGRDRGGARVVLRPAPAA